MATPLKKDGSFDSATTKRYVDYLIDDGIDGLFPLGTTGEFALLSDGERRKVAEAVVDHANSRVPVAIGVSDPCIENVVNNSRVAKDIGADAVVATPPYFYTVTDEAIYEFYKTISKKVDLPLLAYNIPEWSYNYIPPSIVKRLADEKLIAGLKYTQYNFLNLLKFHEVTNGKIAVFTGSDALTYSNLEFGGAGAVIGISNVIPKEASMIYDEYKKGNLKKAKDIQAKALPVIEAIGLGKYPAGLKEAMKLVGMPVGDVKPPLLPATREEKKQIKELLSRAGLIKARS
jgi:4-hydroxy-tetrahydrodipicolinate synthase